MESRWLQLLFLSMLTFLVEIANGEAPAPNYMFSNYDSAMYPRDQDHYHDIGRMDMDQGRSSTGDDYGYTELRPDNPFKGPATSMTHSYSPPSGRFRDEGTMDIPRRPPHKSTSYALWNPFKKVIKNRSRPPGAYPPALPPQATIYGHTNLPDSTYGQDTFGPGHTLDAVPRFSGDKYGIQPDYVGSYSTLPKGKGGAPLANSIYSYYPMKTVVRPPSSPMPPTTSATFELSTTQGYQQAPVRTPVPAPMRGYGQQLAKGFPFSFRKPGKHGKNPHQKLTLNYKGYMPPPPPPSRSKGPYGYTPTSYDGTGLATADYRRRLLMEPSRPYPPAEMGYGGGYDLGTSHY